MKASVLLGDATSHGGKVITASSTFDIGGRPAALLYDIVSCPEHGDNPIIEAGDGLIDEDRPTVVDRCRTRCGSYVIASTAEVSFE